MTDRLVPRLALAAFVACVPPALLHFVGHNKVYFGGWIHFSAVAVGATMATISAIALTVAGARRRDARAVLVGGAFSVMAARRRRTGGTPQLELTEKLPDAVVDGPVVGQALESRNLRGARGVPAGRHHHVLIPVEDARGSSEVDDLAEAVPELG